MFPLGSEPTCSLYMNILLTNIFSFIRIFKNIFNMSVFSALFLVFAMEGINHKAFFTNSLKTKRSVPH